MGVHVIMILALVPLAVTTALPGMLDMSSMEMTFVTRPDLRPPRLNVTTHHRDRLGSGYWFIAPYADLGAQSGCPGLCQVGPHIYDDGGELIWSGACDVKNRNTFDFKVWEQDDAHGLSFALEGQPNALDMWHKRGAGLIMNHSYSFVNSDDPPDASAQVNFHEYTKMRGSGGTLMTYDGSSTVMDTQSNQEIRVWDGGFIELGSAGEVLFTWRALDHINITVSTAIKPEITRDMPDWDWFHVNSVDKNWNGDYLLSSRHADCIYKVSGENGSILWRLGGINSTLSLEGFNFSRQHDARFVDWHHTESTGEVISFLNNGGDSFTHTSHTSAAYLVEIDENEHTARLLQQWTKPDGKLGTYRGNVQLLENGNVFVHWGDNGHLTEFDDHGVVLQEAHLLPTHLGTYRVFKFDFAARPSEPIVVKCSAHGDVQNEYATICYVSWNGATEVSHWEISSSDTGQTTPPIRARKTSFETTLIMAGWPDLVIVTALAADESILEICEPVTVDTAGDGDRSVWHHSIIVENDHHRPPGYTNQDFAWMAFIYIISVVTVAQLLAKYGSRWLPVSVKAKIDRVVRAAVS